MPPKELVIPLREFALPVPRTGSLEAAFGSGRAAAEGQEIHRRVQTQRMKADPRYQAEVPVSGTFETGGYLFRVEGRMDGLLRLELPKIEEIKSGYGIFMLEEHLTARPLEHAYSLQLLTYGYLYWREHRVLPDLNLHLVSSRNGEAVDLPLPFNLPEYEGWLELRLAELVREARGAEKRAARRRKIAGCFSFPFATPRPGQCDLMETLETGMAENRPMLLQAPTGLGKTVGVLYPVLREALGRGQQVVYVTPKNSQHGVVEDAVGRFHANGGAVRSLTVTAKGKICFQDEPHCSADVCEFASDYYGKVAVHGVVELLAAKKTLTARNFRRAGEKYRVCPFHLQLEVAHVADLIICDYNYVFAPRSAFGRLNSLPLDQIGKPNLVIDEAHNLPGRAMEYFSPSLGTSELAALRGELEALSGRFRREAEELLDGCLRVLSTCRPAGRRRSSRIEPPLELFLEQDTRLRIFLVRFLSADPTATEEGPVLRLAFAWSDFTSILQLAVDSERGEFFTTWQPQGDGCVLRITCCDASEFLRESYGEYQQVIGFSATLKPFDYYTRLIGLDPEKVLAAEFASPFPLGRRKLLIIPQVSTKFAERERNYGKIVAAIERIISVRPGNYFVFLPSFDFLDRVVSMFRPPPAFVVVKQERNMKGGEVESLLQRLRQKTQGTIVFAVQGGSLAEGIDYAGEMVIGAFVVGPPLPNYDHEREEMRRYYQRQYGAGFEYAYIIPAMARAVQAAGRVIRSETDRGIVVLMDRRFLEEGYSRAMPADWFGSNPAELVSASILKDVEEFWQGSEFPGESGTT